MAAASSPGSATLMFDGTQFTTFHYDPRNRMVQKTLPSGPPVNYAWDAASNLITYNDSTGTVSYAYNPVNLLTTLTEPSNAQTTFQYSVNGQRTSTAYPNGVTMTQSYDNSQRLATIAATKGGTTLTSFAYSYANAIGGDTSIRTSVTDQAGNKTAYGYDVLNRLVQAQTKASGGLVLATYQYGYDGNGNRTSQTVNGVQTSLSYNGANELTTAGSTTYTFDADGGATGNSAGLSLAYNARSQTTSITAPGGSALAMGYSGDTQVERTSAGGANYVYSLLGLASQTDGTGTTAFTRDNSGVLTEERAPGGNYYYLYDGLGSVVGLTDSSGNLVNTYQYDPYGNMVASTGSVANPWRFAGGYFDTSTGLYKFGQRYYDPTVGRWTQPDPLGGGYLYAGNSPVNFVDPSGLFYGDNNITIGFGLGITFGLQTGKAGAYPYVGLGLVTPGGGYTGTFSPQDPTPGFQVGLQGVAAPGVAGPAAQVGYSFGPGGGPFVEGGVGGPGPAASLTAYYVFGPFD